MNWKPDLREHDQFNHLPPTVKTQVLEADSGLHAAWLLLDYLAGVEWGRKREREHVDLLNRKAQHGCFDVVCPICEPGHFANNQEENIPPSASR